MVDRFLITVSLGFGLMSEPTDKMSILEDWDAFVESRSLPYYRADHQLMMRQILQKYPLRKLGDLSDRDLLSCVNLESKDEDKLVRSFRFFLGHFGQFLERWDLER